MEGPQRSCIVTGETLPQSDLLRFVLDPDGNVTPDIHAKLPGRGMWIVPKRDVLAQAIQQNAFSRAAKEQANVSETLAERVESLLRDALTQSLHMCRKAGACVQGFEKAKAALAKGEARVLLHASDASHDGKAKLNKLVDEQVLVCDFLPRSLLADAFSRVVAVHVAITDAKLSQFFWQNAQRFAGFIEIDTL